MRSVKLLWGAVGLLLTIVLVLTALLIRGAGRETGESPAGPDQGGGRPKQAVAAIGGQTITYEQLQQRLMDKYGAELLSLLLDREAIRQEATERGIAVDRAEIDAELGRMRQGYESEAQFYRSMKEQLGLSKTELNEDVYYKLLMEKMAVAGIFVSEAEVLSYIDQHPDEFSGYVQYHLLKIEVKTLEEAANILKDVQNGAVFGSLAERHSLDVNSGKRGGDLGWIEEDDPFVPKPILEAAQMLDKGEVSSPIALRASYAIIQLKDKREVVKTVDAEKRALIRKELALQKATPLHELIKTWREKRRAEIFIPELR